MKDNKPTDIEPGAARDAGRRRLLKAIGAGGGVLAVGSNLPDKWGKPVVDSVVLPAHAQTTGEGGPSCEVDCNNTTITAFGTDYDGPGPHTITFVMDDNSMVPITELSAVLGAACSGGSVTVRLFAGMSIMNMDVTVVAAGGEYFSQTYPDLDPTNDFAASSVDLTGYTVGGAMYSMVMSMDTGTAVFNFGSAMCTVNFTFDMVDD